MYEHFLSGFDQKIIVLHPGECLVTEDDIILATTLGSCISVALWDPRLKIGGLNHFMLTGEVRGDLSQDYEHAKYGMYAMEMLINELLHRRSRKGDLRAKVFGGGSVVPGMNGALHSVPVANAEFAFRYLKKEGIPVLSSDTGGIEARKILFFPKTGKVLLKRIAGGILSEVRREESEYLRVAREKTAKSGDVTLF